jgi:hypothetical protein
METAVAHGLATDRPMVMEGRTRLGGTPAILMHMDQPSLLKCPRPTLAPQPAL